MQSIEQHKALESAVHQAIGEGGVVRDDASDEVSRTRGRVRTIETRLKNLLKGMNGEQTEQVSSLQMCMRHQTDNKKSPLLACSQTSSNAEFRGTERGVLSKKCARVCRARDSASPCLAAQLRLKASF